MNVEKTIINRVSRSNCFSSFRYFLIICKHTRIFRKIKYAGIPVLIFSRIYLQ